MLKRSKAREQAFLIVFENMFNHESVSVITRMAETYRNIKIIPFGKKLAKFAINNQHTIDSLISENSLNWSLDRISKPSLAILKIAIAELLFIDDIPHSVTVSEAIELSKLYVSQAETKFIHAVLGAVIDIQKEASLS